MSLFISSDHAGFTIKNHIRAFLTNNHITVTDLGPISFEKSDDYPDFANALAKKVARSKTNKGILICGSGQGMCVTANKIGGIRASQAWNEKGARLSREHLNANVLCLGADLLSTKTIEKIIQTWLATPYSQHARHVRRLKKVSQIERAA